MKRKLAIVGLYLVIMGLGLGFVALLAAPVLYWASLPTHPLNVMIVDKTVPTTDYREHKGLMWILNHQKVTNRQTGRAFRYNEDYFGFFPVNETLYDIREIPAGQGGYPDLIYLTDTYGVYTDDYLIRNVEGTRSDMIYGGLNKDEISLLKAKVGRGNTLIGEFNIASSPTNAENRSELEKIFGVSWRGWKGRYFKDLTLNVEVAVWMVENYEKQSQKKWQFSGEGFVLVSDADQIIVLEGKHDVGKKALTITFDPDYTREFGVTDREIPYQYWFEFVDTPPSREIIARYNLDLTERGKRILEELGLPDTFPAVIRDRNSQYTSYYFVGDFADLQNVYSFWNYYGLDKIKGFTSQLNRDSPDFFYWNGYVPMISKILTDVKAKAGEGYEEPGVMSQPLYAKTTGKGFQVFRNGKWEDFFVKGVNLGPALPGKWFTEFPEKEEVYLRWLEQIAQMNANTLRVYTLLPPEFYRAFATYNEAHPESRLWLLQEIWPEENPPGLDYLKPDYIEAYQAEIRHALDALHGQANIEERQGRAYGKYSVDVSRYVLGYLVGRELEPEEVLMTNENHPGYRFKGKYLEAERKASPTEAWLAMNCDYVLAYEEKTYGSQHPVAIVSWPTLDVREHDSEWNAKGQKSLQFNDKASVDINNIALGSEMQAGFFGAYHIYPNYPDFMNNEEKYDSYTDEQGRLRYGGYLQEFMETHSRYPAVVAEFGLATGMGNAHFSPDGYHHGGLTEEEQGKGIVRMMQAIQREGYAGGLVFEWMDEWAKKTWTTEPFMIPYDRHVAWHNALDPEQNYGLLAMESQGIPGEEHTQLGEGAIRRLTISHDPTYLYLDLELDHIPDFSREKLLIGIDTYDRSLGEFRFAPDLSEAAPSGLEFMLDLSGYENSRILVQPSYNPAKGKYAAVAENKGSFEEIRLLINNENIAKNGRKTPAVILDQSHLRYGDFVGNTYNHWYMEGTSLRIRLPWGKLNFSDPSSLQVIHDPAFSGELLRDRLKTRNSEGVILAALLYDQEKKTVVDRLNSQRPYVWQGWDVPRYQERLKQSYYILRDYFAGLK